MKIAIIGGHLSPALAVIQKIKKEDEVFYIGRKYVFEGEDTISFEYQQISKMGIPFYSVETARLQRRFTRHTLSSFLKLPGGLYESLQILKKTKPDVILGFGGYVQIPVVIAAKFIKIPVVIHEQTLESGLTNKLSARFAKKILISFESSAKFFPKGKTVLTGIPLKQETIDAKKIKKNQNKNKLIYITGGSSGSHFINLIIGRSIKSLLTKYDVIHQTGDSKAFNDFETLKNIKNNLSSKNNYTIVKYYNPQESSDNIRRADLVIGRAGINTVAELIHLETPALLIPLSISAKSEQQKNAEFLKKLGLAEILTEDEITDELFLKTVDKIILNSKDYKLSQKVLDDNAADKIIKELSNVSKEKTT